VPAPSTVIDGVPEQFDRLVGRATARDPADRYADAQEMGAEMDAIVDELALPEFRVPAPRNSAQHRSAAMHRSQIDQNRTTSQPQPPAQRPPVHHPTRQFARGPKDWPAEPDAQTDREDQEVSGQFAGIDMVEFALARQHARRMVLIWVAVVLSVTGMVAAAAWMIGSNLSGLL
jgi:serine/threonine protein kinase, bacterial